VREALKGSDVEAIKTAYTDLQNKFQSISEELYKQAAANAGAQGGPGAGAGPGSGAAAGAEPKESNKRGDEGVVDADFEVVDEKDKK
jgi:molecular chaperone DnaK